MSHPMPKDLKEDDRFFGINFMDLHLTKKGLIYNGGVTLFSVAILKIFENVLMFRIKYSCLSIRSVSY